MMTSSPMSIEVGAIGRSAGVPSTLAWDEEANRRASQSIAEALALLREIFVPQRRIVHAGDLIYQNGERR